MGVVNACALVLLSTEVRVDNKLVIYMMYDVSSSSNRANSSWFKGRYIYTKSIKVHLFIHWLDTCIICIDFHDLFRLLEPDDSKVSLDVRVFRYPSGRDNAHQPHIGQPSECNKFFKPVTREGLTVCQHSAFSKGKRKDFNPFNFISSSYSKLWWLAVQSFDLPSLIFFFRLFTFQLDN